MSDLTAFGGVLDLTDEDFSRSLFFLNGEWEHHNGKLYTPDDFANNEALDGDLITVPTAWHHAESPLYGVATFRLIVKTDEPELLMFIPEMMDASVIWINNTIVFEAGVIGETKSETIARSRSAFAGFTPVNGQVEIVMQAANYDIIESWGTFGIEIGKSNVLLNDAISRRVLVGIFIGLLLTLFIYQGILFFYNRKDLGNLFTALLCVFGAGFFALERNGFASLFLANGIGVGLNRIYYLLLVLQTFTVIGFIMITLKVSVKRVMISFYCVFLIIMLFIIFLPFSLWNTPFAYTGLIPATFVYISAVRSKKLKENPFNILLVSSIIIYNVWNHFCWYVLNDTFYMQNIASYVFLVIGQCIILSVGHVETKRKEELSTEQSLILGNLNRLKTEFLQDMSHEMKTPLTLIATGIDYTDREINKKSGNISKVITVLEKSRNETQRLGRMIEGMLKLSTMSEISENRRRLDFADLLINSAETFRLAFEQRNNSLRIEIMPDLPDVFVEKDRFIQVIANLLSNATEHTQDGQIALIADYDRSFITVKVTDTGCGIPPEISPHIFKRGISGRNGTGYGLNLCRIIVEAHGGTIEIESEPNMGTTATFTVPVYGGQEVGRDYKR
jgi:signal transduction histidine kinase